MMALVRLVFFGLVAMSIVYLSLSIFSRSLRREKLEKTYDADPVAGISRSDYVEQGMEAYKKGLRPKLLLLVYIVPTVIVGSIVYVTNAN